MAWLPALAVASVLAIAGALVPMAGGAQSPAYINWPSYLLNTYHHSYQKAATTITPANAGSLTQVWTAPIGVVSSPTVYDGVIYVGGNNGDFYALNEATGQVIWSEDIGVVQKTTCGERGFASTATVTTDPSTGDLTVYVAAATGYLYALNAQTGATVWKSVIGIPSVSVNNYFDWSSPAVANGRVYVGISSQCDLPLVRGGLKEFDQSTGKQLAVFWTVPAGTKNHGGSIWSSPAVDSHGDVWVTTGNGPEGPHQNLGYSLSIIELNGTNLQVMGSWQIPGPYEFDSDFGGSPTLFTATLPGQTTPSNLVGACNKNGNYYVLNQADPDAGPVWQRTLGLPQASGSPDECIEAGDFNGSDLFLAGPRTTINGTASLGSLQEVNPSNGDLIWQTPIDGSPDGSPTLDGAGVLAIATYDSKPKMTPSATYLLNASNGDILATLNDTGGPEFATPIFADQYLILGTVEGITTYTVATSSS